MAANVNSDRDEEAELEKFANAARQELANAEHLFQRKAEPGTESLRDILASADYELLRRDLAPEQIHFKQLATEAKQLLLEAYNVYLR